MRRKSLVPYYRVSTDKQGRSGLGIDAQRKLVGDYRARLKGSIVQEFTEVETGKRNDRPELAKALALAKRHKATLVIAKLDRLSRNTVFLLTLIESGVDVGFCDLPEVPPGAMGKFFLTQMAAVAELEAGLIGERTKAALAAYRDGRRISKRIRAKYPEGVPKDVVAATAGKLGASLPQCRNLTPAARKTGAKHSVLARRARAIAAYEDTAPGMLDLWERDVSLRAIAEHLNRELEPIDQDGEETETAKPFWSAMKVKRVLDRFYPDRRRPARPRAAAG